jgi:hypothetical protein
MCQFYVFVNSNSTLNITNLIVVFIEDMCFFNSNIFHVYDSIAINIDGYIPLKMYFIHKNTKRFRKEVRVQKLQWWRI